MVRKAWETKGGTTAVARRGAPAGRAAHVPRTGFLSGRRTPTPTPDSQVVPAGYQLVPAGHPFGAAPAGYGQLAPVPPLPVLHQRPGAAPGLTAGLPAGSMVIGGVVVAAGEGESVLVRANRAVRRWAWRNRFELAPVYAGTVVLVGASAAPLTATAALAAVAAGAHAAARWAPLRIAGRAWLSVRERTVAAAWCAGGAVWAGVQATGWVHPGPGTVAALVAVTGPQAIVWARSRRVRPLDVDADEPGVLSEQAGALIAAWPGHVAEQGPAALVGSHIDPDTMREPAPGAYVFAVELGTGVHSQSVTGDTARQHIERTLRLPVGCVQLDVDREDCGRVLVTMTPARHLERNDAIWAGPVVVDGRIPAGVTPAGTEVSLPLYGKSGIYHLVLIGTSGSGKSRACALILTAGPKAGHEVILYLDGKGGCSAPDAAHALDYVATKADEYGPTVEMFGRILDARVDRYGAAGISEFDVTRDPIVTLFIDEAAYVKLTPAQVKIVVRALDQGRSVGCRVVQVVQKPGLENYIGGTDAKQGLMGAAGSTLALRPATSLGGTMSLAATSQDIDLRDLPPGKGWACALEGGTVLGMPVRMYHATPDLVREHLQGFVPRSLAGADAEAAGQLYADRTTGAVWAARMTANKARLDAGLSTIHDDVNHGQDVQDHVPAALTAGPVHPLAAAHQSATAARIAAPHLHIATTADLDEWDDVNQDQDQDMQDVQDSALTIGAAPFTTAALTGSQAAAAAAAATNRAAVLDVVLAGGGDPVSRARIVTETGLGVATVKRALKALRNAERVSAAEGGGWTAIESAV